MAAHVRTTIRYDGPALIDHEMDVQDLAPALLALADVIQATNKKFNGSAASIRVLVNADVEQKCFQIDVSLVQSVLHQAKTLLGHEEVKTALEIAKDIGIVSGATMGVFKLLAWLAGKRKDGTQFQVTNEGGTVVIIAGDGNSVRVSNDVYDIASDPVIVAQAKRVVEPLKKSGYETLSFVSDGEIVETLDTDDAEALADLPNNAIEPSHEAISQISGPVRIKAPQYEGNAKWTVLWGGRAIEVTMPADWVKRFQENEIEAPPNTTLIVRMTQKAVLDQSGVAIGNPQYTVEEITNVILPPKPLRQQSLFEGGDD